MGNVTSIIGGGIAIIIGIIGLINWWDSFAVIMKGFLPLILLLGGVVSLAAGISDIKKTSRPEKKR
ncbi:MAG: hypothetical protein JW800_07965 [Candidatus Omnitrophica bacterium]|nr:hypothetical protein [Candidatus Omnitrophota bacterium]